MTVHEQLMTECGMPTLLEQHGTPASVAITPPGLAAFTVDAILGTLRGTELINDLDQTSKLLTASVQIRRSDFAAKRITEMPMMAKVNAYGMANWSIDYSQSEWGAVWVKLGLQRETLAREFQATRNAAV